MPAVEAMGLVATWKEDENVDGVGSIELNEIFDQIDRTRYVTCLFSVVIGSLFCSKTETNHSGQGRCLKWSTCALVLVTND